MRLGQLARKYGVSLHEITAYLQEIEPDANKLGRNSKLNKELTAQVARYFEHLDILNDDPHQEQRSPFSKAPITGTHSPISPLDEEQVQNIEETQTSNIEESISNELIPSQDVKEEDPPLSESQKQEPQKKEQVAIETDKLLELLESEESAPDLSKITLIKAPKRELGGLKVVGKIELPEPKVKTKDKSEQSESLKQAKHDSKRGMPSQELSEVEREKRRLKAKRKKEQYEARRERRRKQKEKQRKKAINKARYQQKLERMKSNQAKPKGKPQTMAASSEVSETPPAPKTLLGKFLRWMNT